MRINFITLSSHRSGSSVLQRYLDSHPEIKARQEELRAQNRFKVPLEDWLKNFFTSEPDYKVFGFKVQYSHIRPALLNYIKKNNIKVIQLIRRDMLETCFWHSRNYRGRTEGGFGTDLIVPKGEKIEAKIPNVIRSLKQLKRWIDMYRKLADFTLFYEDDMTGGHDSATFYNEGKRRELFDFFRVEDSDHEFSQRKAKRLPLEKIVVNYKELKAELRNRDIPYYWQKK